jgi:predicted GNAT family acetyltransferase
LAWRLIRIVCGHHPTRFDSTSWVGRIDVPTSVLIPLRDSAIPPPQQFWLANQISEAQIVTVDAGHTCSVLQYEKFVAADVKYTIAVDGETVGFTAFADRDNQRVFYHTEIDDRFGGRGLANILVGEPSRRPARTGTRCRRLSNGRCIRQEAPGIQRHDRPGHPGDPAVGADAVAALDLR